MWDDSFKCFAFSQLLGPWHAATNLTVSACFSLNTTVNFACCQLGEKANLFSEAHYRGGSCLGILYSKWQHTFSLSPPPLPGPDFTNALVWGGTNHRDCLELMLKCFCASCSISRNIPYPKTRFNTSRTSTFQGERHMLKRYKGCTPVNQYPASMPCSLKGTVLLNFQKYSRVQLHRVTHPSLELFHTLVVDLCPFHTGHQ